MGERLNLRPEPANNMNVRAVLVTDSGELPVGYVPDPLLGFVHEMTDVDFRPTGQRP